MCEYNEIALIQNMAYEKINILTTMNVCNERLISVMAKHFFGKLIAGNKFLKLFSYIA